MTNTQLNGDVAIRRHLVTGGNASIAGNAVVAHNLTVNGWLYAKNIKNPIKGFFQNVELLATAFPHPRDGWLAGVGSGPFFAYVGKDDQWVPMLDALGEPGRIPITYDWEKINAIEDNVADLDSRLGQFEESLQGQTTTTRTVECTALSVDDISISREDGVPKSPTYPGVNAIKQYAITDTGTYYATGRVGATLTTALVHYYDANGAYLGCEYPSTGSVAHYDQVLLTVPSGAATVRVSGTQPTYSDYVEAQLQTVETVTTSGIADLLLGRLDALKRPDKLRMLVIGNSYSLNSMMYLPFILKNYGIDIHLGIYYRSGAGIDDHVGGFGTSLNALYAIDTETQSAWTTANAACTARQAVQSADWQIVILQQSSLDSPTLANYDNTRSLINLIADAAGHPIKLGWNININRAASGSDYAAVAAQILENIRVVTQREGIGFVLPYGTAVFNARSDEQLAAVANNLWHEDMVHLQEGLPCYIAALANAQAIFDAYYPHLSVLGDQTRPTAAAIAQWNVQGQQGAPVGVTEALCRKAQYCALKAAMRPFSIEGA